MVTRKLARLWRRSEATLPEGVRVYAIGDVHGQLNLLNDLLRKIGEDSRANPIERECIVFLGDLIDRGPDSKGVIESLRKGRMDLPRLIFLAGNHEEMLLRLLDDRVDTLVDWMRFGGKEFCESYGLDPNELLAMPTRAGAVAAIRAVVPAAHVEFIRGFGDSLRIGDYVFVHAGVRPGVKLEDQTVADLHWIREDFLESPARFPFIVVHGHTISREPEQVNSRIGIDTGAYNTGILTALRLQGTERRFIQAAHAPKSSCVQQLR